MKTLSKLFISLFLISALHITLCTLNSNAEVPHLINYQGKLTDSNGVPLNGTYNITFRIYNAQVGGNLLWEEPHTQANGTQVTITNGIFSIMLGSVTALNLPFDQPYWLSIQVGGDPEMTPRQQITSVGYAIEAENSLNADKLGNQLPSYYLNHANLSGLSNNNHPQYTRGQASNIKIAYGSGNASQYNPLYVTFPFAFSSNPIVVTSVNETGAQVDDHGVEAEITSLSPTGCTINHSRTTGATIYWLAIGPAE